MAKAKERIKFDHHQNYIALVNAIGGALNKNHKFIDIFDSETRKTTVTDEEKEEMKRYLEAW